MSVPNPLDDLFRAVAARWAATDLATLVPRVYGGEASPDATRPYAVCYPIRDSLRSRTNKGRYSDFVFEVRVVGLDFDDASRLGYTVMDRLLRPPMTFTDSANRLLQLVEGDVRWQEEEQYWQTVCDFTAALAKPGGLT